MITVNRIKCIIIKPIPRDESECYNLDITKYFSRHRMNNCEANNFILLCFCVVFKNVSLVPTIDYYCDGPRFVIIIILYCAVTCFRLNLTIIVLTF